MNAEFYVGKIPRQPECERAVVSKWFYSLSRQKTFVGGKCAPFKFGMRFGQQTNGKTNTRTALSHKATLLWA